MATIGVEEQTKTKIKTLKTRYKLHSFDDVIELLIDIHKIFKIVEQTSNIDVSLLSLSELVTLNRIRGVFK